MQGGAGDPTDLESLATAELGRQLATLSLAVSGPVAPGQAAQAVATRDVGMRLVHDPCVGAGLAGGGQQRGVASHAGAAQAHGRVVLDLAGQRREIPEPDLARLPDLSLDAQHDLVV